MEKVRVEFLLIGAVLVIVGLVLIAVGHGRIQPTLKDQAVGFLEQLTSSSAPAELKSDKSAGYLTMGIGALLVVGGIGLFAACRPGGATGSQANLE